MSVIGGLSAGLPGLQSKSPVVIAVATPSIAVPRTALVFPNNTDVSVDIKVAFKLTGANVLNIREFTEIKRVWINGAQTGAGYSSIFWHSRGDGAFSATPDYVGFCPYSDMKWEISAEGGDDRTDENGNNTDVAYATWIRQAGVCRPGSGSRTVSDYYWDLGTSTNRVISRETGEPNGLNNSSNSPHIMWGENLWSTERMNGRLRGIQLYDEDLTAGGTSTAHIVALSALETDAQVLEYCAANGITSLWFLNMNPTPDDITDKSGNGRHAVWQDASNKAVLLIL